MKSLNVQNWDRIETKGGLDKGNVSSQIIQKKPEGCLALTY